VQVCPRCDDFQTNYELLGAIDLLGSEDRVEYLQDQDRERLQADMFSFWRAVEGMAQRNDSFKSYLEPMGRLGTTKQPAASRDVNMEDAPPPLLAKTVEMEGDEEEGQAGGVAGDTEASPEEEEDNDEEANASDAMEDVREPAKKRRRTADGAILTPTSYDAKTMVPLLDPEDMPPRPGGNKWKNVPKTMTHMKVLTGGLRVRLHFMGLGSRILTIVRSV
jgi:hypothetical protein